MSNNFIVVKDSFYKNPEAVHKYALNQNYFLPEDAYGYRSDTVYHETLIKKSIESEIGYKIKRWDTDPFEGNGVFHYSFSEGKYKDEAIIHYDEYPNDITILIYLTPNVPTECGTSFWKHKKTSIEHCPERLDAKRNGLPLNLLKQKLIDDSYERSKWTETTRIGYKFNRMIAFRSGMYHSATKHFGSLKNSGRIIQTFRVGI